MLSRTIGISAVAGLLFIPLSVDAHPRHRTNVQKPVHTSSATVIIEWRWVSATLFRSGHWHHPHHGRSYRSHVDGPPPHRPHAQATWVPGHWEGNRRHRRWVPGHWVR